MKVDFETAEYFSKCYERLQPGWFLPPKQFARVRVLIGWDEHPPTPEGFDKAINAFIAKELGCQKSEEPLPQEFDESELTPEEQRQLAELGDKATTDD